VELNSTGVMGSNLTSLFRSCHAFLHSAQSGVSFISDPAVAADAAINLIKVYRYRLMIISILEVKLLLCPVSTNVKATG